MADCMAIQWGTIDHAADPLRFIGYLDTLRGLETIQRIKERTFDLLEVREGDCLLDVGCGTGDDVRRLARRVGATGRVVGVDASQSMVAEAQIRSQHEKLPVEFYVEDAERLRLTTDTFDGCRAERLFIHLNHPQQALAEMVRVARPGARVVVFDADWETLIVDASNREITRKLLNFHCDRIGSRWIGRQLHRLFDEAGLTDIVVVADTLVFSDYGQADFVFQFRETAEQASALGVVSSSDAHEWLSELERAQKRGIFFAAVTGFCVSGRK